MINLPAILIAVSAAVVLLLGLLHLLYTFHGPKLSPRDPELMARMREVSPVITRETTMWKAWVGFNASHSFGAILFGAVYGYLSTFHAAFLFQSNFLLLLGLVMLVGYLLLAKNYFFCIPLGGILAATVLYSTALSIVWLHNG
ncbi:MAG: hypothetical protein ABJC05_11470 [Pyrinomonadaceae bacterium]